MCTVYVGHDIEDLRCYIMTDGQILRPGTRLQVDVRTVAPGGPVREPQEDRFQASPTMQQFAPSWSWVHVGVVLFQFVSQSLRSRVAQHDASSGAPRSVQFMLRGSRDDASGLWCGNASAVVIMEEARRVGRGGRMMMMMMMKMMMMNLEREGVWQNMCEKEWRIVRLVPFFRFLAQSTS